MSNAVNIVYAWLSIAMGYLFCRTIPVHNHPFGAFLFIFAAILIFIIFGIYRGNYISSEFIYKQF